MFTLPRIMVLTAALIASNVASASIVFYTTDYANNSTNWSNDVIAAGGTINTNVDFESHGTGALNSTFYQGSDGVSITSTGISNQLVKYGVGDYQGNTSGAIAGEGVHSASNFLDINEAGNLTVSFDSGASAAGIFAIDVFSAGRFNFEVFSGANGTGTLLGALFGVGDNINFQNFGLFFMGARSTTSDTIGSFRLSFTDGGGDDIGYDNLMFASANVPEPAPIALLLLGIAGILLRKRQLV